MGSLNDERPTAPPDAGPPPDAGWVVVDDEERIDSEEVAGGDEARDADSMDAVRVRQLSAMRRGAYRTRSYCVVGMCFCAVAAVQLVVMTVRHLRDVGWEWRPVGYLCGVAAAMMAAAFLSRHVAELTRELRRPAMAEPDAPPDFSTLSDGTQHWKNLEDMQRQA